MIKYNSKRLRLCTFIVVLSLVLISHTSAQSANYQNWEINADDLIFGKIVLQPNETKTLRYKVTVKRSLNANGSGWLPVNFKFWISRLPNGYNAQASVRLTYTEEIKTSDFPSEEASQVTKEYSLDVTSAAGSNQFYPEIRNNDKLILNVGGEWAPDKSFLVNVTTVPPSAPTNANSTFYSSTYCELTWNRPAEAVTGYRIYKDNVFLQTASSTNAAIGYLSSNTSYSFTISAYNNYGESSTRSNVVSVKTLPDSPTNLSVSNVGAFECTLHWEAPTGTINGYKVYRNGSLVKTINGTINVATITGLNQGSMYGFSVSAIGTSGESDRSSSVSVTTGSLPTPPSNLRYFNLKPNECVLAWDKSSGTVEGYRIYQHLPNLTLINTIPQSQSGAVISLQPNIMYGFYVVAFNEYGESNGTNHVFFMTPDLLSAPSNLVVNNVAPMSCLLSWTAPSGVIGGYKIYKNGVFELSTTNSNVSVTSLIPNTNYTFTVSAINSAGESPLSNQVLVNTPLLSVPSSPTNLIANGVTSIGCNLSWQAASGIVSGYKIYQNENLIYTTGMLTTSINNLMPASLYTFTVRAFNSAGESTPSNTISVNTPHVTIPNAPTNLTKVNSSSTSCTLSWTAPPGVVTGYYVYMNVGATTVAKIPSSSTSRVMSNLSGSFTFFVSAYNNMGESSKSNVVSFNTLGGRQDKTLETDIDDENKIVINESIKIFPNPFIDMIHVSGVTDYEIYVFDLNGRRLDFSAKLNGLVDLSRLPNGIYIAKIKTQDGISMHRIVKNNY